MQFTDVNTVSVNILWNGHLNSFRALLNCMDTAMPKVCEGREEQEGICISMY